GPPAVHRQQRVVAVDHRGLLTPLSIPVGSYGLWLRLSPDGGRLALAVRTLRKESLWVYDLARGAGFPLTHEGEAGGGPLWFPDARHLLVSWTRNGRSTLAMLAADGREGAQELRSGYTRASSFAPDGRVAVVTRSPDTGPDIMIASIQDGKAHLEPLVQSTYVEQYPEFSPDGKWLVFGSNMSGRDEIYVQPYPGRGGAVPVSVEGGGSPAWHPNGREIFFLGRHRDRGLRMMAVSFTEGSPPRIGSPRELFGNDGRGLEMGCGVNRCYDLSADGTRFYAFQSVEPPPLPVVTEVNLIQNWFEELKAKVPPPR
ncbi:MAG: hypothetical protein EHM13_06445, partial [Acidobacteria bacterium]